MLEPTCYCTASMTLKESRYGRFWGCTRWPECDGVVGAHQATGEPLGTPAPESTRRARQLAHAAFDRLWRTGPYQTRKAAYAWLAGELGITRDDCHMALFDETTCRQVIILCLRTGMTWKAVVAHQ